MKIGGMIWERPKGGKLLRLGGYLTAGFLSAACALEGRAPLAAGFLAACRPGQNALAALCGGILGSFTFLGFGSALRCCGIFQKSTTFFKNMLDNSGLFPYNSTR